MDCERWSDEHKKRQEETKSDRKKQAQIDVNLIKTTVHNTHTQPKDKAAGKTK